MSLEQIQLATSPIRNALLNHPIYESIVTPAALRTFMEQHIFAVWDFMSLLKEMQRQICCVNVPWQPVSNPSAARLINEIVLGEETDEDGEGGFTSHFNLYLRAMQQFGAETRQIDSFMANICEGEGLTVALERAEVDESVCHFVNHTFSIIRSRDLCQVASAFTFGREDLLPDVFQLIVDQLDQQSGGGLGVFKFYLQRHIDLDGGEHGPMASRLISVLCGNDPEKWQRAQDSAVTSLLARKSLWDGIHKMIRSRNS